MRLQTNLLTPLARGTGDKARNKTTDSAGRGTGDEATNKSTDSTGLGTRLQILTPYAHMLFTSDTH